MGGRVWEERGGEGRGVEGDGSGNCFIKLRSNPTRNSPTMNNTFPVVVKNSNF